MTNYNGSIKTDRKWWQFWKPEYHKDLWRCEHCHQVYSPFLEGSAWHENQLCLKTQNRAKERADQLAEQLIDFFAGIPNEQRDYEALSTELINYGVGWVFKRYDLGLYRIEDVDKEAPSS